LNQMEPAVEYRTALTEKLEDFSIRPLRDQTKISCTT
jgi:hypothetical protein